MFKAKKIGLALSGGGAKGMAHIGVLKVLEKNKIPIDFISGTSIGAVIAALYSYEPNAKKLEKEAVSNEWKNLLDYTFPSKGFIKGERIEQFLKERLKGVDFKHLKIPLFITAFDIDKKQEIVFQRGDVAKAVRASISIPGVFVPIENNNRILVDGGVLDPIPTEVLRKKADIIIAVNVDSMKLRKPKMNEEATLKKSSKKIPGILKTIFQSLTVIGAEASRVDLYNDIPDLIINVNLGDIDLFDFEKAKYAIKKGVSATQKSLKEIKALTKKTPFKDFLEEIERDLKIRSVTEIPQFVKDVRKKVSKTLGN
ncbi:MAG: patatin-like phospholipase family protein [Candidatus Pacearchaeota archaeon]|nr:patatin-like phospholipase family protein [Candidatus Pacearchaeota archaeon]